MSTEEQKVIIEEVTEETPSTNETVTITEPKVREPSPFKNYFDKMNKKMSKYKRQESKQNTHNKKSLDSTKSKSRYTKQKPKSNQNRKDKK